MPSTGRPKRHLNLRLLLGTLAVGVAGSVAVVSLYYFQIQRSTVRLLRRADQLEAEGRYREAVQQLRSYLEFRPDDTDQRVRQAELFDKSVTDWRSTRERRRAVDLYYRTLGAADPQQATRIRRRLIPRLLRQERLSEAKDQSEALLAARPDDGDGWKWLATALYRLSATASSQQGTTAGPPLGDVLARAIEINPDDPDLAAHLADVYRNHAALLSDAQQLSVAEQARESDLDVVGARGRLANQVFDRMVSSAAASPAALLARYRYRSRHGIAGADADLDSALEQTPDDYGLRIAAGQRSLRRANDTADSRQSTHLSDAAAAFQGVLDAAEILPAIASGSEEQTQHYRQACIGLARVRVAEGRSTAAIEVIEEGLRRVGTADVQLNVCLADVAAVASELAKATAAHQRIDNFLRTMGHSINPATRRALARSQTIIRGKQCLLDGELVAAVKCFRRVTSGELQTAVSDDLTLPSWLLLGEAHARLHEWWDAATAFEIASKLQPQEMEYLLAAGEAWENAGQGERALRVYTRVARSLDHREVWISAARAHLKINRELSPQRRDWDAYNSAITNIRQGLATAERRFRWRFALLRSEAAAVRCDELATLAPGGETLGQFALASAEDWILTETHAAFLAAQYPDLVFSDEITRLETTWEARGRDGDTRQLFEFIAAHLTAERIRKIDEQYGSDSEYVIHAAQLYERIGRPADADRLLATAAHAGDDPIGFRIAQSQILARRGDYDGAQSLLASQAPDETQHDRYLLNMELAELSAARGTAEGRERAALLLRALYGQNPADVTVVWQLADLAILASESSVNATGGLDWNQRLRELEGEEGYRWKSIRMRQLLEKLRNTPRVSADGLYREALDLAHDLQRLRPDWSLSWAAEGWLLQYKSRLGDAVASYQKALEVGGVEIDVCRQLLTLLFRLNRLQDADDLLAKIADLVHNERSLAPMAMSILARTNNKSGALAIAKQATEDEPDDPMSWVWLAQMQQLDGRSEEAEQSLARAAEFAPRDPRVVYSRFGLLVDTERFQRAEAELSRLLEIIEFPSDSQRLAFLARTQQRLGNDALAAKNFQQAAGAPDADAATLALSGSYFLARDPAFAEQLLRQALQLDPYHTGARRALAALLAERPDPAAWSEARAVLGDDTSSDLAQRLRAMTLLEERENVDAAIETLEQLVARTGSAQDRFMLANVYLLESALDFTREERESRLANARRHYEFLASRELPEPQHAQRFVDFLLRYESRRAAASWLPKVKEALVPANESRAAGLAEFVGFLLKTGFRAQATPVLDQLAEQIEAADNSVLGNYVDLCWQSGELDRATTSLQKLVDAEPNAFSTIARQARILVATGSRELVRPLVDDFARRWLAASPGAGIEIELTRRLAALYSSLEMSEAAETWLRKLVQLDPTRYALLAEHLARQGRAGELVDLCVDAVRRSNGAAEPVITLALSLSMNDVANTKADAILDRAVKTFSGNVDLLVSVASLRQQQGRINDAEKLFATALEIDHDNGPAHAGLALLLSRRPDQANRAIQHANRALQVSGPTAELLAIKGTTYLFDGRPAESLDLLKAAASGLNPSLQHQFYYVLALIRSGDRDEASGVWGVLDQRQLAASLPAADAKLLEEVRREMNEAGPTLD